MVRRLLWEDLDECVREAIAEQAGSVLKAETVSDGINSEIALIVHAANQRAFLKGVAAGDERRCRALNREALINPFVEGIAPRVLWQAETDGWNLVAFEHIDGRHVDYTPGSPDLLKVAETLTRLGEIACPQLPVALPTLEERCANHTPAEELWRCVGDRLLHTDLNPGNVLVTENRAYLVDWAVPTKGAAWSDPFDWALCLIASGHTPAEAEDWAAQVPGWHAAEPNTVDVGVRSQAAVWADEIKTHQDPWTKDTADATRRWAEYRAAL